MGRAAVRRALPAAVSRHPDFPAVPRSLAQPASDRFVRSGAFHRPRQLCAAARRPDLPAIPDQHVRRDADDCASANDHRARACHSVEPRGAGRGVHARHLLLLGGAFGHDRDPDLAVRPRPRCGPPG